MTADDGVLLQLLLQQGWTSERYVYRGDVTLAPEPAVAIEVVVTSQGRWKAEIVGEAASLDGAIATLVTSLTRTAVRSCVVRGQRPPRRVRRWRERPGLDRGGKLQP